MMYDFCRYYQPYRDSGQSRSRLGCRCSAFYDLTAYALGVQVLHTWGSLVKDGVKGT
jgi:hypothetical protein